MFAFPSVYLSLVCFLCFFLELSQGLNGNIKNFDIKCNPIKEKKKEENKELEEEEAKNQIREEWVGAV